MIYGDNMTEMTERLDALLDHMRADYKAWADHGPDPHGIRASMYEEYSNNLDYTIGKKYIKVLKREGINHHPSVCAFVVNVDNDKKFNYGDILMPAGWAAPARNFARGNIFDTKQGFKRVRWTGAL